MKDPDNTKALAPINWLIMRRESCPICGQGNVPMRWDWTLYNHGPGGRCTGDPEVMLFSELVQFGLVAHHG